MWPVEGALFEFGDSLSPESQFKDAFQASVFMFE